MASLKEMVFFVMYVLRGDFTLISFILRKMKNESDAKSKISNNWIGMTLEEMGKSNVDEAHIFYEFN